jgi:hypothetical protein
VTVPSRSEGWEDAASHDAGGHAARPSALAIGGGLRSANLRIADCVAIARPDHWFKNVFMLPGAALAFVLAGGVTTPALLMLLVGMISISPDSSEELNV